MPTREKLRGFVGYVKGLTQKDEEGLDGFDAEYKGLVEHQAILKKTLPAEVGRQKENLKKNRYKDIVPYDDWRVPLPHLMGPDGPVPGSDYINASFIKDFSGGQGYIAAMGPLSSTTVDFWRMLWHYNVHTVVMLCNIIETGRKKCAPYFPASEGTSVVHGEITIQFIDQVEHNANIVSTILAVSCGDDTKIVRHFHFRTWPDHGVPNSSEPIVELIQMIRDHQPHNETPIVVHCSAGCGRTGTVISVDYAWQLLENGSDNENLSLPEIVGKMREYRVSMVQTKEQYVLIYRSVLKLAKSYMRSKKEKAKPVPPPPVEEDLYGNMGVSGINYGLQVLALGPKIAALPESPYFTVRVAEIIGPGDDEEADIIDKMNSAVSTGSHIYEKDAEQQVHDDDTDERAPIRPQRRTIKHDTESAPCYTTRTVEEPYMRPVNEERPKKPSRIGRAPDSISSEDAAPSLPVRTEDSYQIEGSADGRPVLPARTEDSYRIEGSPDTASAVLGQTTHNSSLYTVPPNTGLESEVPSNYAIPPVARRHSGSFTSSSLPAPSGIPGDSSPGYCVPLQGADNYSSITEVMPEPENITPGASRKWQSTRAQSIKSSPGGDRLKSTMSPRESVNHGRAQSAGSVASSPVLAKANSVGPTSSPLPPSQPVQRRGDSVGAAPSPSPKATHGLKRVGRPKGPRPLPSHWKLVTV